MNSSIPFAGAVQNASFTPGSLKINTVEQAHAALLKGLSAGGHVEIPDVAPDGLDAAGLQLLIAAHRTAKARGGTLRLAAPPGSPLCEGLETYGMRHSPDFQFEGDVWVGMASSEKETS